MNIYLDIETLPTNDAEIIASMEATITAPGNYKKPESIAEWLAENKESALKELVAKTSFDGLYGRIACIAWAHDDGDILCSLSTDSEGDAIQRLYDDIKADHLRVTVCGHNVHGFDLPFLKHRSIILGIKPPAPIMRAMNAKSWADEIADTMVMWSDNRDKRVSMDKLCKALGIDGKNGFDGSMVAETWPKDPNKVIEYCKDDVSRARKIYKRMTFA
jgi:3'-5' exonuclease